MAKKLTGYAMVFPPEDKMGFAVPVAPGHSLKLLNNYMRTDLLRSIHQHLHRMIDNKELGSPLDHLTHSLNIVIEHFEGVNLFECVNRNPFHMDSGYKFDAEQDYLHDIKLMKHHLNSHRKTLKALGQGRRKRQMNDENSKYEATNLSKLPANISVKKRGNNTYVIFRNGHEEIGGIVVRGTPLGDTQLQPYVEEPQDRNKTMVALVAQQMSDALLVNIAKKPAYLRRDAFPSNPVPAGTEVFENKVFPCSKCNQIIARLVFSWDTASTEEMEMVGKKFELDASVSDYPVWVLGAPDCDDNAIAKHLTFQIAPAKGAVYWEHPDDMNKRLIDLETNHC